MKNYFMKNYSYISADELEVDFLFFKGTNVKKISLEIFVGEGQKMLVLQPG